MAFIDMTGVVVGKLTVIRRLRENSNCGAARWECVCECGEKRSIAGTGLRAGRHKSCGCSSPKFKSENLVTHGMAGTRTFSIWSGMHHRCKLTPSSKSSKSFKNYYGKGIRVDARWNDFLSFVTDMGEAPPGMSIDRIDGNRGYEPGNCRWATAKVQANNMSSNHIVTFNGEKMTVSMWADKLGIKANTIIYRLRRGWGVDRALSLSVVHASTAKMQERSRPCPVCGNLFIPRTSQIRDREYPVCSHKCNGLQKMALKKCIDNMMLETA